MTTHILLISPDTSRTLNRNFYYLEQQLTNLVKLSVWRKPGHIDQIKKKLSVKPDFILLLNDLGHRLSPQIKGLNSVDIPTGLFVNDVHRLTKEREGFIEKNNIKYLFTVGREQFIQTYPHFRHKMKWFPHFVNTKLYKDYRLVKDIQLLMIGAVNDYYPLRKKVLEKFSGDRRFVYHKHPGYREFSAEEEKKEWIGERYARQLNRAEIFFTCPSIFNYPVMKYYEALACKTLLLAPTFRELEKLGYSPGKHFVAIDENNFQEKAAYYLANEEEREQIAEQGYQFIRQTHTVEIRAQQLVGEIERILRNNT